VAQRVGIGGRVMDAADLPADPAALAAALEEVGVLGRVAPERKAEVVRALAGAGHVVAMAGDGINDVLALKAADIAVAMGNGSAACRAISHLVLVDGDFRTLPAVVAEGRRVIGNIERVANLYLTKTCYALLLALSVAVAGLPFPLLPRHYTLVGSLTIGIPSLFLALEATAERVRAGFLERVLRFAVPTGMVAAAAGFGAYVLARLGWVTLSEARTTTTLVLLGIGFAVLAIIARPATRSRLLLLGGLVAATTGAFLVGPVRDFYALDLPHRSVLVAAIGIVIVAGAALRAGLLLGGWLERRTRVGRSAGPLRSRQ
jgi:magnesium-transporting ATPase (P-type)